MNFDITHPGKEKVRRLADGSNFRKRYFFWPFRKKKKILTGMRPGALLPEVVKQKVKQIGIGKQAEILRIGYDGQIDDMPILIEIIDIDENGFSGKIVNLERRMIEGATDKLVYAKKGGGILDFRFDDGDIKEIVESQDEKLLSEERNIKALSEILAALEIGDRVLVAYYDAKEKGTLNAEGVLLEKDPESIRFTIQIEKVNRIELERKIERTFNISEDLVIDIEII